jgi:serine/threonine-protein kinase
LKKYSLSTGLTQSICVLPDYFGGDWGTDGTITFVGEERKGLWKVAAAGGTPTPVAPLVRLKGREEPRGVIWPQALPGGRVLVSDEDASRWGDVGVLDPATRELRYIVGPALSGKYVQTGHLLYVNPEGTLFAVPFDPMSGEKKGAPVAAVKNVTISANLSGAFAVSDIGSLVYATGYVRDSARELSTLVRIDRAGGVEPLSNEPGHRQQVLRLSPDGRRLAAVAGDFTIWTYDLRRNSALTLPSGRVRALESPVWAPDGERLVFGGDREGAAGWKIFWQKADGSGEPEALVDEGVAERHPGSITPDGHHLLYSAFGDADEAGIWAKDIGTKNAPRRLLGGNVHNPMISPNGRWFAYASAGSGTLEVFAERFPELGHKVQVSVNGGTEPVWSRDGREVFYRKGDRFFAVSVVVGSELVAGAPELLFEKAGIQGYDVAPDGKGFIAIFRPPDYGVIRELHLVTNWFEELKRLAPTRELK